MQVLVSAKTITVPRKCACCGQPPDTSLEVTASRTTGKRAVRTTTNAWSYPYCSRCIEHVRSYGSIGGGATACFLGGCIGGLLIGTTVSGGVGFAIALVAFAVGAMLEFSRKAEIKNRLPVECASPGPAVAYLGWQGTVQAFEFLSPAYAADFANANRPKLVNVSYELAAVLETAPPARASAAPPRSPVPSSMASGSAVMPPGAPSEQDLFLKWMSKVESLKGPAARRAAAERAMTELRDAALRERLLLEVAKLNVHAALDKADSLKTVPAKRRTLTAAMDEIRNDAISDELQRREIALLDEALNALSSSPPS